MESAKCAAELGKIMKYSQNCGENEEKLAIFTVILMATFGIKNVHSEYGFFVGYFCNLALHTIHGDLLYLLTYMKRKINFEF